ncbi:hypothetical protein BG004_003055, partial [Podila humilis]
LQIDISGIPAENGKCRVETQLKIGFHIKDARGGDVHRWKQLRLPHSLIAKEKHRMEKYNGRNKDVPDSEILTLDAKLVCDHDMTKKLETCDNCIGRERKRAHRRKETQRLPGELSSIPIFGAVSSKNGVAASFDDEPVQPTPTDPIEYQAWERSRIMVFSNTEFVDLSGGQIQFTARDSTGSAIASVLTHAVMMMDDHKSGKKAPASSSQHKRAKVAKSTKNVSLETKRDSKEIIELNQVHSYDQASDLEQDQDNDSQDEHDEDDLDLETGNHTKQHNPRSNSKQSLDAEMTSKDTLSPLGQPERVGTKRRVTEGSIDDVHKSVEDPTRGPFRRKTSHDVSDRQTSLPFFSTASMFIPATSTPLPNPSPFVPGSTFAIDEGRTMFTPTFAHATSSGSFLDQKYMNMFMNGRPPSKSLAPTNEHSTSASQEALCASNGSLLEDFSTLDEAMSTPPKSLSTFMPSVASSKASAQNARGYETSTADLLSTRASFTIPTSSQPTFSNPFMSSFLPTSNELVSAPKMTASFLDASQIQEFQNFKKQSTILQQQQQHQQQQKGQQQQKQQPSQQSTLQLLQAGIDRAGQKPADPKAVRWSASRAENKDPYWNMRTALSQSTSPSSSAFIPIPTTLPEDGKSSIATEAEPHDTLAANSFSSSATPLLPKKRGRPRKSVGSASQANSPVISSRPVSASAPSSPSLSPINGLSTAQMILLQHRQQQQQQLHHHQQQLQQQQKQAILARQKPRVQKLIPSRGSIEGGTEVTLLGSGFFPGMVPSFGGVPAVDVQYYGPETMICRLPPREFPGTVVVKAPGSQKTGVGLGHAATGVEDDSNSTDLVKTMAQLFGGPSSQQSSLVGDDDVGVLFEYEESNGDRDLIALALQVLGMKMSGRVEPPHQVAMRIMGTAAATNAIMQSQASFPLSHSMAGPLTTSERRSHSAPEHLQQPQPQHSSQQPGQQQPVPPPSLLQFSSVIQATSGFNRPTHQPLRAEQTRPVLSQAQSMPILTNGSIFPNGILGYSSFLTPLSETGAGRGA